jgi:predicted amidohydrolase
MKVALVQFDIAWEDVAENHRRVAERLKTAAGEGARLAILPEMFPTGFSMDAARIAQPPGGRTETFLKETAAALSLWIIGSIPEAGGGETPEGSGGETLETKAPSPRNTALVVSPAGAVVRYSKIHPFTFAGEHRHYAAGDRVVTVPIDGVRVTPFVCYDLRFPEPFRFAAKETDLFVVVANWPDARREHWRTLLRARAIENLAFVAGVNRVGDGGRLHYSGDSALVDPWGDTLAEGDDADRLLAGVVDPARVAEARAKFPVLEDVRAEAYRR